MIQCSFKTVTTYSKRNKKFLLHALFTNNRTNIQQYEYTFKFNSLFAKKISRVSDKPLFFSFFNFSVHIILWKLNVIKFWNEKTKNHKKKSLHEFFFNPPKIWIWTIKKYFRQTAKWNYHLSLKKTIFMG